jgi:hypothetical protein
MASPALRSPLVSPRIHRDDPARYGSQGDAHRDFARTALDAIREHTVQTDGGECEGGAPKHRRQLRRNAVLRR